MRIFAARVQMSAIAIVMIVDLSNCCSVPISLVYHSTIGIKTIKENKELITTSNEGDNLSNIF